MDYKKYKDITVEKADKILTVTFNRPDDLNAVSEQLHLDLSTIFIDAEYDDLNIPIYQIDPLVRRGQSLQKTSLATNKQESK